MIMNLTIKMFNIGLFFISAFMFAQQDNSFVFYRQHLNLFNPAYVGVDNITLATSTLRKQWTGVEQAPETQSLTFGSPIVKNLGIGLAFVYDRTFIEKQSNLSLDFSYKLKLNELSDFYFGLRLGSNSYDVNTVGIETYNLVSDPALGSISSFSPSLGFGLLYKRGNSFISLSAPRLFSADRVVNELGYLNVSGHRPHVYLSGGFNFLLSNSLPDIVVKPSVMMRYVNRVPVSIDFTTMIQFDKSFDIGGMYRTDKAYAIMSTLRLSNRFLFGFAYEMSTRPTQASAKNTNEILIQFQF